MHIDRIPVYRVYQRAIDLDFSGRYGEKDLPTNKGDADMAGGNGCVRLF